MTTDQIESFIAYLEDGLIPDLQESGREATAQDFETCIEIIRQLQPARELTEGCIEGTCTVLDRPASADFETSVVWA